MRVGEGFVEYLHLRLPRELDLEDLEQSGFWWPDQSQDQDLDQSWWVVPGGLVVMSDDPSDKLVSMTLRTEIFKMEQKDLGNGRSETLDF